MKFTAAQIAGILEGEVATWVFLESGDQQQDEGHLPIFFITEFDRHRHRPAAADQDDGLLL